MDLSESSSVSSSNRFGEEASAAGQGKSLLKEGDVMYSGSENSSESLSGKKRGKIWEKEREKQHLHLEGKLLKHFAMGGLWIKQTD